MVRVGLLVVAICALIPSIRAIQDKVTELRDLRTKEGIVAADALTALVKEYKYSEDVMEKAFERCKDKSGASLMPCLINALHIEKTITDHKYDLCIYEYLTETGVECSTRCFTQYNPKCLECVGKLIPQLIDCIRNGPSHYVSQET